MMTKEDQNYYIETLQSYQKVYPRLAKVFKAVEDQVAAGRDPDQIIEDLSFMVDALGFAASR